MELKLPKAPEVKLAYSFLQNEAEWKKVDKLSEQVAQDLFGEAAGRVMHDINTLYRRF